MHYETCFTNQKPIANTFGNQCHILLKCNVEMHLPGLLQKNFQLLNKLSAFHWELKYVTKSGTDGYHLCNVVANHSENSSSKVEECAGMDIW